jgi:hypothetical protein
MLQVLTFKFVSRFFSVVVPKVSRFSGLRVSRTPSFKESWSR